MGPGAKRAAKPKYDGLMDGETIRLIVVACGATAAGLGGALIAGAFNSQNTLSTIEAAKAQWDRDRSAQHEQWNRDRAAEHEKWLRDRKVQSYAKFLHQVQDMNNMLHDVHEDDDAADTSRLPETMAGLAGDELMLISPEQIKTVVGEVI